MKVKDLPDDDREAMYAYLRDAGCGPEQGPTRQDVKFSLIRCRLV